MSTIPSSSRREEGERQEERREGERQERERRETPIHSRADTYPRRTTQGNMLRKPKDIEEKEISMRGRADVAKRKVYSNEWIRMNR